MDVETFEITETTDQGQIENIEEVKKLVDSLGLSGQERFVSPDDKEKPIFAYRKMTQQEANIYRTLCPFNCELQKYQDGMIPLRVLQVAAHVKETEFIDTLEVWYPRNADVKDPVLVGVKKIKNDWGFNSEYYILARWGTVLEPLEKLAEQAKKMLLSSLKLKWAETKAKVESDVNSIESCVEEFIQGASSSTPSFTYYGLR